MPTFLHAADSLLRNLCEGIGLPSLHHELGSVQELFLQGWGAEQIPEEPEYASCIGDDHSPFEYSLAVGAQRTELRLLVEAQSQTPDAASNQAAALALNPRLAQRFGASFERFDAIKNIFLPDSPQPPFSLWHAVCFGQNGRHDFKVYLNPFARGPERANQLVAEALDRLGLAAAQRVVDAITNDSGLPSTPNYFSLDLSDAANARVKVYFQHLNATAPQLDRLFELSPTHRRGDVVEFCRALVASDGPFLTKPLTSCFSFVEGQDRPLAATFHLPIAHYVPNDLVTLERVTRYLTSQKIDPSTYAAALRAFAMRPLDDAAGIQSYASFRREASGIRFTAYLSPELFREATEYPSELRLKSASTAPQPIPASRAQGSGTSPR
jgi:DMATS type aromatic prenyltransferase